MLCELQIFLTKFGSKYCTCLSIYLFEVLYIREKPKGSFKHLMTMNFIPLIYANSISDSIFDICTVLYTVMPNECYTFGRLWSKMAFSKGRGR